MRKRKFSKKPLGRTTPRRREKIKKETTAIPTAKKKEKKGLWGFRRTNMTKATVRVETKNFNVSKIRG